MSPRPDVLVHFAASLDGRIALPGPRTILSGPEGQEVAHRIRASCDAVAVGRVTVETDDPRLTVRHGYTPRGGRQPLRVVFASRLRLPAGARVMDGAAPLLVVGAVGQADPAAGAALEGAGHQVLVVPSDGAGQVGLGPALEALGRQGVRRLLIEGGARLVSTALRGRLVDELSIEMTPTLFGQRGLSAVGDISVTGSEEALRLDGLTAETVGRGVLIRGRLLR